MNTGSRSFEQPLVPLFSYLPRDTLVVSTGDLEASADRFWQDITARFENRRVDPMRPLLPPETLWLHTDQLFAELKQWPRVRMSAEALPDKAANTNLDYQPLPMLAVEPQAKAPLDNLRRFSKALTARRSFRLRAKAAAKRCRNCWRASS